MFCCCLNKSLNSITMRWVFDINMHTHTQTKRGNRLNLKCWYWIRATEWLTFAVTILSHLAINCSVAETHGTRYFRCTQHWYARARAYFYRCRLQRENSRCIWHLVMLQPNPSVNQKRTLQLWLCADFKCFSRRISFSFNDFLIYYVVSVSINVQMAHNYIMINHFRYGTKTQNSNSNNSSSSSSGGGNNGCDYKTGII